MEYEADENYVKQRRTSATLSRTTSVDPARVPLDEDEADESPATAFAPWAPKRAKPYGYSLKDVVAMRYKALAALIVFIILSVTFAVVGSVTFWADRMTWKTWFTLYTLITMLSVLILDMWDVSLTFFVTNTVLCLSRVIVLKDALAGFSNDGILSTAIMFIIARAIEKTRVLEWVVRVILRRPIGVRDAMARLLPAVSFWSVWTNNTPIVAVMIPVIQTWATRTGIPVSRLLMPMSFCVILGGVCSLVGTSTNLVIQGLASTTDLGFFDVGVLGGPYTVIGIFYCVAVVPYMLPDHSEKYYVSQVYAWHKITTDSPHVGKPLIETKLIALTAAELLWLKPAEEPVAHLVPDCKGEVTEADSCLPILTRKVQVGDLLCYIGRRECIEDIPGMSITWYAGSQLEYLSFFEMRLSDTFPDTPLTVREFNTMFKCRVRRISHNGQFLHFGSGQVRGGTAIVSPGDVTIVEGGFELLHLQRDPRFKGVSELAYTVGKVQSTLPYVADAHPFIAVASLLLVIIMSVTTHYTIYEAATLSIIMLLITDTMNWHDIYTAIPGNLMIMICYSFSLAKAMDNSGLAALFGDSFSQAFAGSPYVQLLGIYMLANVITAIAPNSATATIVYPIVQNLAKQGRFSILAGIYCLMIASSADFLTPFGYQCNLMVQKPGNYKFADFTKFGLPLTIIGLIMCPGIANVAWPVPTCNFTVANCTNISYVNQTCLCDGWANLTNFTDV